MERAERTAALERTATSVALLVLLVVLVRTAWVCDDAFITFRTVDNLLHGFGPRWNVAERVQAYTHPLWMLTLAASQLIARQGPYLTSILLSLACTIATAALLAFRVARSRWQGTLAILILINAKSFMDFSTSGLENALSHLLIVAYVSLLLSTPPVRAWRPIFAAALLLVNRQDLVWLVGPSVVAFASAIPSRRRLQAILTGLLPLVLWETFSVVYYGFFVPNTAFAKLATGIPERELLAQGLWYLQESWQHDPLTLIVVLVSILGGFAKTRDVPDPVTGSRSWPALALGQLLYLTYVVLVGGDFMSGRFLAAPLLLGVAILAGVRLPRLAPVWQAAVAGAIIGIGLMASAPNLLSGPDYGHQGISTDFHGITDERKYYYPQTGWLRSYRAFVSPEMPQAELGRWMVSQGQRVATHDMVGMFGYGGGPELHVVDNFALGDPLLARLPSTPPWRIGHFGRALPDGYIQTLRTGTNQIADSGLAEYYNDLRRITREPIFSAVRFLAVLRMNLGLDDHLLANYRARASSPPAGTPIPEAR